MEIVVIEVSDRSSTEIDINRRGRDVVIMSRTGALAHTFGVNGGVREKYVAFGAVTLARGPARDDRR